MTETNLNSLEYLSGVFKGLSVEKKDCVLNTARSLLKIQDDNNNPVNSQTASHNKKKNTTSMENLSAYASGKEC